VAPKEIKRLPVDGELMDVTSWSTRDPEGWPCVILLAHSFGEGSAGLPTSVVPLTHAGAGPDPVGVGGATPVGRPALPIRQQNPAWAPFARDVPCSAPTGLLREGRPRRAAPTNAETPAQRSASLATRERAKAR